MQNFAPAVATNATGTSAVTIIPASGDAATFRDILCLAITTINAAAATLTLSDGTNSYILNYPNAAAVPTTPLVVEFPVALQAATANTAWTLTASANASGFRVVAQYVTR